MERNLLEDDPSHKTEGCRQTADDNTAILDELVATLARDDGETGSGQLQHQIHCSHRKNNDE